MVSRRRGALSSCRAGPTGSAWSQDDHERLGTCHGDGDLARTCAINAIAAIRSVIGDLDRIEQVVKVVGFVSSAPDFTGQPGVINGASELLGEVFGAAGEHARSAVGVAALPLGAPVEVEVTVRVRS